MLTPEQVRAARAILDWSQQELADKAGTARMTIRYIEEGKVQPQRGTLADIRRVFDEHGIEFIGERGVALRHDNYRILEGSDCYLRLLDEVYHTLQGTPDAEVLSICTDDSISPPEVVQAIQRWHDAGIKCRFLSHDKAKRFDFPLHEYRLISSRFFRNSVMVVFSTKVATLRGANDAVLILNDKEQAEMLRGLFELIWSQAAKPPAKRKK